MVCHFLLAQKVTMLRPAARHQLLQLSNLPDPSGGFVREKTHFFIFFFSGKKKQKPRGSKNSLLSGFSNRSF
jgi:hypothetical protein